MLLVSVGCSELRVVSAPEVAVDSPVGIVVAFAGKTAPAGWLLCDGRAVNRAHFAALFAVIGTSHGVGDGQTTFNLPDYRGRFLRGVAHGLEARDPDVSRRTESAPGGNVRDAVGSVQDEATGIPHAGWQVSLSIPEEHTHPTPTWNGQGGTKELASTLSTPDFLGQSPDTGRGGAHVHRITGGDSETRPKNVAVEWIIRTAP